MDKSILECVIAINKLFEDRETDLVKEYDTIRSNDITEDFKKIINMEQHQRREEREYLRRKINEIFFNKLA